MKKQLAMRSTPEGEGTFCLRVCYADGFEMEMVTNPLGLGQLADKLEKAAKDLREALTKAGD